MPHDSGTTISGFHTTPKVPVRVLTPATKPTTTRGRYAAPRSVAIWTGVAPSASAAASVSEPLPGSPSADQLADLRAALAPIAPSEVTHGPLRSFPPHPGVVYAIEPAAAFRESRAAVHGTSLFAASPLARRDIAPHITLAEFITSSRTEELLRELRGRVPTGRFRCDRLEYAVPNGRFFCERVLALPLGGAARPPG